MSFDIKKAKKSLGINSNIDVHYCMMCHGMWECNCHMCYDDKPMMCYDCHAKYQNNRGIIEDLNSPPHLMRNESG